MGFFDALRAELVDEGIRVTTIVPGFVRTDISKAAITGSGEAFGRTDRNIAEGMDPDEAARRILAGMRKGKMEIPVGKGIEMHALWLKRFFPKLVLRLANRVGKEPAP